MRVKNQNFLKKKSALLFLFLSTIYSINSVNAEVIDKIKIEGNHSIGSQLIVNLLPFKVGDDITGDDINIAVKKLFSKGFFSNVNIAINNNTLLVNVTEQNAINKVIFEGNSLQKDNVLIPVMSLQRGRTYNAYSAALDEQAIKNYYEKQGYGDVIVQIRPVSVSPGNINLVVSIEEGIQARVGKILFVGNHSFPDNQLKDVIISKSTGFLSFLKKDDVYTKEKTEVDKQLLQLFYQQRGYADFYVDSVEKHFDPETNKYVLTYHLEEGKKYTFGKVLINNFISGIDVEALRSKIDIHEGDVFDSRQLEFSQLAMNNYLLRHGHPFATINQSTKRNLENNTIDVSYQLVQGAPIYINRIVVRGNTKTREWVIRQEFTVNEGDAFNRASWLSIRQRLLNLGFFSNVEISLGQTNKHDRVNVIVTVVEQPTGQISASAGYVTGGAAGGANFQGSISQSNFLGRGEGASLSIGGGLNYSFNGNLSYNKSRLWGTPMSGRVSLSGSTVVQSNTRQTQLALSPSVSFPVSENVSGSVSYILARESYTAVGQQQSSPAIREAIKNSPWYRSSVSYALTRSTIDNFVLPREGTYLRWQQELAGLGGNAQFLKTTVKANYFKTLSPTADIIAMVKVGAGFVAPLSSKGVRIFDLFKNNTSIIRGFDFGGIGPVQENSHLGGTTYFHATGELDFPIPYVADLLNLRGAVFVDSASLFGNPYTSTKENPLLSLDSFLRVSTGFSIIWHGPFGPFRVDWAWPLRKRDTDSVRVMSIGISNHF